jgi:hypothetical protein
VDKGEGFSTLAVGIRIPNKVAAEGDMLQTGMAGHGPATPM